MRAQWPPLRPLPTAAAAKRAPLHDSWTSGAMDRDSALPSHSRASEQHFFSSSSGGLDDDFAILSNESRLSMDAVEPPCEAHHNRQLPFFPVQRDSLMLDNDDFESISYLSRPRKPRRQETQVELSQLRIMSTAAVTAVGFFCVCGGPLGPETIIADDPVTGTLGVVLFPLLCSGPMAYIIAELCSAQPEDGGYIIWVLSAFGPTAAFQAAFWGWVSDVFGRVYRIALAYNFLASSLGFSLDEAGSFCVKAAMAVVLTIPSLLGTRVFSWTALGLLLVGVLLPYVLLTIWGYTHETFTSTGIETSSGAATDWIELANTLYWSYDGFHLISTFGGCVLNPARTFPHAIYSTYLLVFMLYLLPMLASYTATRKGWLERDDWSFPSLASTIGGPFLHGVIVFSSIVGLLAMYTVRVFCDGHQLSGAAEVALIPGVFRRRNQRFGSPHMSIFTSLVAVVAVTACKFDLLLPLANSFSAFVQLSILVTALKLRRSLPYMPRPAKVPGGMPLLLLFSVVPALLLGYFVVHCFTDPVRAAVCGGILALGVMLGIWERCFGRRAINY